MTSWVPRCRNGALVAAVGFGVMTMVGGAAFAADAGPGEPVFHRLSSGQYKQVILDVFGPTIKANGRFEPDVRADGLLAVGSSRISVTSTGFQLYDSLARSIASQVVAPEHRATLLSCKPADETKPDDACAREILSKIGRLLYRRPLSTFEMDTQLGVASSAATSSKSFYSGLATSLSDMLIAPQFLFRQEVAERDPAHPGQFRLDAYSKASRLSFLLWNSSPDPMLLAAAEKGELSTEKGLAKQVERLLASPRLADGVGAFFTDMLGFEEFDRLEKDPAVYPKYNIAVARDMQEQTLRTITDLLVNRRGDYRDLFTTRQTFLTPTLAAVYGVPLARDNANGAPDVWTPYVYPEGDPRVGILTQASFVALHSHPGRTSPTLRGKALREVLLCQKVPDPPGNVNFSVVQDTSNPAYKTARERVTAHRTDALCAGCHKIMDPMGLALENFDSSGGFRATENGAKIDGSGELDGMKFTDAASLGKVVHDHPAATSCFVNRIYAYADGHAPQKDEAEWIKSLQASFAADGYRVTDLLRRIVTSENFYRVAAPQTSAAAEPPSQLASQTNTKGE